MRRTKEAALGTRRHIISKAVELFLIKGFSNTRLEEIAVEAGVTRGAIYWHFKDKPDIVSELITTEMSKIYRILECTIAADIPPLQKIERVIVDLINNYFDDPSFSKFIELTWFKMEYSQLPSLKRSKTEPTVYFIGEFNKVVHKAQLENTLRADIRPQDITLTLVNMINGMYRLSYILPTSMNSKEETHQYFRNYLMLIKKEN